MTISTDRQSLSACRVALCWAKRVVSVLSLVGAALLTLALARGQTGTSLMMLRADQPNAVADTSLEGSALRWLSSSNGGLLPGESMTASLDLARVRPGQLSVFVSTMASPSSLLDQDPHGLQLAIDRCSLPWIPVARPHGTQRLACPGTTTQVLATRPLRLQDQALSGAALHPQDQKVHLRLTVSLPIEAGNEFQGLTSGISYRFSMVEHQ